MANQFSARSEANLEGCHADLQRLFREVLKEVDHAIVYGHRDETDQDQAFVTGHSKVKWPNSAHNQMPSRAVDAAPCPIDWDDVERFKVFGAYVKAVALRLGIAIRWGGDFVSLKDYDHFELVGASNGGGKSSVTT